MNANEQQFDTLKKAVGQTASEVGVAAVALFGHTARGITWLVNKA